MILLKFQFCVKVAKDLPGSHIARERLTFELFELDQILAGLHSVAAGSLGRIGGVLLCLHPAHGRYLQIYLHIIRDLRWIPTFVNHSGSLLQVYGKLEQRLS